MICNQSGEGYPWGATRSVLSPQYFINHLDEDPKEILVEYPIGRIGDGDN